MRNIPLWIKRNWWKILIPILIIPILFFMYWIKKHNEVKQLVGYAEER